MSNDDLNDCPDSSHTHEKIKIPEQVPLPDSEPEPEREPSPTPPPPPPVTPPRCTPQLDAPPALPRHSKQICCPPLQPGNIFGEWEQPIKQIKEMEKESCWKELTGREQPSEPVDQLVPGAIPPSPTPSEDDVERLVQEGGDALVSFLCMKAIPLNENPKPYCKWFYCNILHLPESEQKLWFEACKKELDMLKECKVYEIVDQPTNCKVIKNC